MGMFEPMLRRLALVGVLALGGAACEDDDDDPPARADAGVADGGGSPDGGSGPDGGCRFVDYVVGLIDASTTPTALPSPTLGDECVDDERPFPASVFE